MYEMIELKRECEAIEIPSGIRRMLPALTRVRISQFLGSGYTVVTDTGYMCRIDAKDSDAMGMTAPAAQEKPADVPFSENMVWDQLKTVFDPEIPVNIVDLGLIYSCKITDREQGGKKVAVDMSMTAPGCGMGDVLKEDVRRKVQSVPGVREVQVDVVWDPPWDASRMSDAARLQLGWM